MKLNPAALLWDLVSFAGSPPRDHAVITSGARHTFATTVTLANHVSMESVSKMLGHTSINMTRKYARIAEKLISEDMEDKIFNGGGI